MTTQLETMAETARKLANELFSSKEAACSQQTSGNKSCIQAEEDRPLTKVEKNQGWTRRPFFAYEPDMMCAGCAAYFFAERAAQTLHEMRCWQIRAEAESNRQAVVTSKKETKRPK